MKFTKRIALVTMIFALAITSVMAQGTKEVINTTELAMVQGFKYDKQGEVVKGKASDAKEVTITVAATSDIHGRIYPYEYAIDSTDSDAGYALTYNAVKKIKAANPNTLLMDIGDVLQDNSAELFNNMDVHPMIEAMNYMGYDLWVPGNHEFNFGLDFVERNINAFTGRVVSSNVMYSDGSGYFVNPYQIFLIDGVRVAVVGGIAPHVPQWEASTPEHFQGLDFASPVQAVKNTVKELDGQYDVLIAAMHVSRHGEYSEENIGGVFELANEVPEIDLIIGGHEHATYCEKVNDTWVLEPGKYGAQVSFSQIKLAKDNGKWMVKSVAAENIPTKGIEASPEILNEFADVHEASLTDARTVIGEITEDFVDGVDYITGSNTVTTMPRTQMEDTALIDLINTVQQKVAGADVASCATFSANQALFKGSLKKSDVAFIYKYSNTLMGVNMTGKNLLEYMEWSVAFYNTYKEGDVTISFNPDIRSYNYDMFSGINYKIDVSKEAGNRIVDATINNEPINLSKIYKVAVNNYRYGKLEANGWATPEDIYYNSANDLNPTIRDLIRIYVQEDLNGKLAPECDNNWTIIGTGKSFNNPEVLKRIKSGEITIPKSDDGRTPNIKSVNIHNL